MAQSAQRRLSLLMMAAVLVTVTTASLLANAIPYADSQIARDVERHRSTNGYYLFNGGYIDDGDHLLIGQLPKADYSRGGVYFIGASEMNAAIMAWTLPPAERKLIHNYSIGDLRHTEARHFARLLVEELGLLEAGGEKTTVILGLSWQMAREKKGGGGYVKELFERHGHYSFDWNRGIHRVPLSSLEYQLTIERDRANRFLRMLFNKREPVETKPWSNERRKKLLVGLMTGDWRQMMAAEVRQAFELIDYLKARSVRVKVILHPTGSWQSELPFDAAYRAMVLPELKKRDIPTSDFGDLLSDDEFFDHVHARYSGQTKLHAAYRELALKSLAEMDTKIEP
jgi:hypothetical protein